MATEIYKTHKVKLFNGTEIELSPLKIKYLRELMDTFHYLKNVSNDDDALLIFLECVRVAMKQYYPEISGSVEEIEDNLDLPNVHKVLEVSAGIKLNKDSQEPLKEQAEKNDSGSSWEELDLAKMESEVFLLGAWKNYEELETSLSMTELISILSSKRELDYEEKRFLAAIQGVDLDQQTNPNRGQKEWEDLKARVFSGGTVKDSNDILALQGQNAKAAGFGIGMGLDYEDLRNT
jgi:translation initiation factor 1 (eIF-1/SUI1)